MTRLQQLVTELQKELVAEGMIPAVMTAGTIELNMNESAIAAAKSIYYAKPRSKKVVDSRGGCLQT